MRTVYRKSDSIPYVTTVYRPLCHRVSLPFFLIRPSRTCLYLLEIFHHSCISFISLEEECSICISIVFDFGGDRSIFAKEEKVYIIIDSLFFLPFGNLWWNNRSKESGTFIYLDWRHPWIHELIRCIVRSIRYGPSRDAPWLNPSWWLWCTSWSCKSIYKIGFEIRERIYFLFYTRIVRVTCNLDGCKSPRRKPGKSKIDLQGRRLYFRPRIPVAWRSGSRISKIPRRFWTSR